MDSKYNSVGVSGNSKKFSFTLKRPATFAAGNHKPKKTKKLRVLNTAASVTVVTSAAADSVVSNVNVSNIKTSNGLIKSESILEERRKLPVYAVRGRLLEEIKKNQTMIIIGETGCGKTTQIPQIIHEARLEGAGMVGVTQPRRVAAISIAIRVAKEMNTNIGDIVGYSVRFEEMTSLRTKVKYLTDGMLLREAMGDALLRRYSVLVLDEAHERTVSTDVLFGIVRLAQKERKEKNLSPLKLIVMSATMDVDAFSSYLDECPVIYLEGRTHPVSIHHAKRKQDDYQHAALCTVFQLHATAPPDHDFLVFLTGQEEIEILSYNIKQISKEVQGPPIKVCPMYAGLPQARQLDAWKPTPPGVRKVVLATNIAETSVTIPGIKCVIDTGVVKESCPLASTVLWMIAVGIEPRTFPLLSPPPESSIQASLTLLHQLGAVDNLSQPKLTVLGKKMSAFPIDPKYSKVLLSANDYECLDEALSIVAVLSSENIFHTPIHKREDALKAKQKFISPLGDHITMLNVFKAFTKAPLKKQWCKENYLHHRNLSYASEVRQQLATLCQRLNVPMSSCGAATDQVIKCLVSGMFSQTAWLRGGGGGGARYVTAGGAAAALHPASALHATRPPPPALLYTELLTTHRTYMACVSALRPQWLHQVAPEFARRCRAPHS